LKEWTTPDCRNTPSTTNLEEKEIVDVPGNDGIASMSEHVKRPNPWRKMMMMMKLLYQCSIVSEFSTHNGVTFCPFEACMYFGSRADAEFLTHFVGLCITYPDFSVQM